MRRHREVAVLPSGVIVIASMAQMRETSMKRLLLFACASAIGLSVGLSVTGAQAERLQYSQPAPGALLAQTPVEGGAGQFATLCRKQCEQTFAACHNRNANDPSCSADYNICIQGCR